MIKHIILLTSLTFSLTHTAAHTAEEVSDKTLKIFEAIDKDDLEALRALEPFENIDTIRHPTKITDWNPVTQAAYEGKLAILHYLLQNKAKPKPVNFAMAVYLDNCSILECLINYSREFLLGKQEFINSLLNENALHDLRHPLPLSTIRPLLDAGAVLNADRYNHIVKFGSEELKTIIIDFYIDRGTIDELRKKSLFHFLKMERTDKATADFNMLMDRRIALKKSPRAHFSTELTEIFNESSLTKGP